MTKRRVYSLVCLAAAILTVPAATSAQTVGFGPKVSQVRGGVPGSMWSGGLAFYV
jgi:hypothetical protein